MKHVSYNGDVYGKVSVFFIFFIEGTPNVVVRLRLSSVRTYHLVAFSKFKHS